MPAIKSTNKTEFYKHMTVARASHCEDNDCSVIAVAAVTNSTYTEAHRALEGAGRKQGRGVNHTQIIEALAELGYVLRVVDKAKKIAQYPAAHQILKGITTHHPDRFNKVWADGKNYLFFTTGHVAGVVNGTNHDWTKGRAKRVNEIWEIVKA